MRDTPSCEMCRASAMHSCVSSCEVIGNLPLDEQQDVAAQAARLIEEEMTLRDLRKASTTKDRRFGDGGGSIGSVKALCSKAKTFGRFALAMSRKAHFAKPEI
jgi:hypothetical protein